MKHHRTTILLLLSVLLFSQCSKPSCFKRAGELSSIERNIAPFHRIDLFDNISLVLTQDTVETLRVEANERLHANISSYVENGVLTLKNTTDCNWLRDPTERIIVYVSVNKLDHLYYSSSGSVTSTNTIVADTIKFYSDVGAGDVNISLKAKHTDAVVEYESADFTFRGKTDICNAYVNARGSINFEDFEIKTLNIGYASVRNTVVNVTDILNATIYHTGNLYYKGTPSINTSYFSSGRLYTAR